MTYFLISSNPIFEFSSLSLLLFLIMLNLISSFFLKISKKTLIRFILVRVFLTVKKVTRDWKFWGGAFSGLGLMNVQKIGKTVSYLGWINSNERKNCKHKNIIRFRGQMLLSARRKRITNCVPNKFQSSIHEKSTLTILNLKLIFAYPCSSSLKNEHKELI